MHVGARHLGAETYFLGESVSHRVLALESKGGLVGALMACLGLVTATGIEVFFVRKSLGRSLSSYLD